MPCITESDEWRLLQSVALLWNQRKSRHRPQKNLPAESVRSRYLDVELLEVELRQLFSIQSYPYSLQHTDFDQCQLHLERVCSTLDCLILLPMVSTTSGGGGTTKLQRNIYPRLEKLSDALKNSSEFLDLFTGPNRKIFEAVIDADKLPRYIAIFTNCNNILSQVFQQAPSTREDSIISRRTHHKKVAWKKSRIRNRAKFVLQVLFQQFNCLKSHEVLLKLITDPDDISLLPELQLLMSLCPGFEAWQEVRCDSESLADGESVSYISDICADLRKHAGEGKTLNLLIKKHALLGAWMPTSSSSSSSGCSHESRKSLDQLITAGAFKPLDVDMLFHGAPAAKFTARDKRTLAVKLGFCLMDFFDANVASDKIHFLGLSRNPEKDVPYLAFDSSLSKSSDLSYNFEAGHPTLLSFAKLLLEIEYGQKINIDIHAENSQNLHIWAQLLTQVDRLALEKSDPYLQAIQGCLVVHRKIAKALNSWDMDTQDCTAADSIIRKKLYKEVVRKLEDGLAESTPRPLYKRHRSESPPPKEDNNPIHVRSPEPEPERRMSDYKRRRMSRVSSYRSSISPRATFPDSPKSESTRLSVVSESQSSLLEPSSRDEFEIAILCALPLEYNAVSYLLDEIWDETGNRYGKAPKDPNVYTTGLMSNHNVVVAQLGKMGKVSAAAAAASMRSSYNNLRLAILVGVCGAVPYNSQQQNMEILLGDVIISKAAVQYDFGRQYQNTFKRKDSIQDNLPRLSREISNFISRFETIRGLFSLETRILDHLEVLQTTINATRYRGLYDYPGIASDKLYKPDYRHKHRISPKCDCTNCIGQTDIVCDAALNLSCLELGCDDKYLIQRSRTKEVETQLVSQNGTKVTPKPVVHVGLFGSGDSVLKSAVHRDRVAKDTGAIGFEMEGAGIWEEIPSIIVKGVCDYADSHKSKDWQNFAAATAASTCKAIIESYTGSSNRVG